jgi:CheY-like chemotaxis protein
MASIIPKYAINCSEALGIVHHNIVAKAGLVVTSSLLEDAVHGTMIGSPRSAALEMGAGREMRDLSSKTLISVIDDDEDFRATIADLMHAMGFTIEAFSSAVDFLASPYVRDTSCLITDLNMPRMTGTELHSHLVGSGYDIPTILITAYPDDSARTRALGQGIVCYLSKPLDVEALLGCVRSALQRSTPKENLS